MTAEGRVGGKINILPSTLPFPTISMSPLLKDQEIIIDVEELVYGGEGRACYNEQDVLIHRGVPGDRLRVRITGFKDTAARADIIEVITPSDIRQVPICPVFLEGCGGCQWLHMDYEAQLYWKGRMIARIIQDYETLSHVQVHQVMGMDDPFYYRNKMVVRMRGPKEALRIGFQDNKRWVLNVYNKESGQCYIQHPLNNQLGRALAVSLTQERRPLKSATIRVSDEEEVSLDLEKKWRTDIASDLEGIGRQTPYVHYTIHDRRFRVTSPSFFQANTRQTGVLVETVLDLLPKKPAKTAIDVYCGVGLFTLFLTDRFESVYGIEESKTALEDARHNAETLHMSNVQFIYDKAENALPEIMQAVERAEVILVDPPRSGCNPDVLHAISQCRPGILVYISCNASTLVRDLDILDQNGMKTTDIRPVDMFPHTYHVECVARCVPG